MFNNYRSYLNLQTIIEPVKRILKVKTKFKVQFEKKYNQNTV